MPLYQYECSECGRPFEAIVSRPTADATEPCPACGSAKVARTFGLPARPVPAENRPGATACPPDGSPCGASWCGRS